MSRFFPLAPGKQEIASLAMSYKALVAIKHSLRSTQSEAIWTKIVFL